MIFRSRARLVEVLNSINPHSFRHSGIRDAVEYECCVLIAFVVSSILRERYQLNAVEISNFEEVCRALDHAHLRDLFINAIPYLENGALS